MPQNAENGNAAIQAVDLGKALAGEAAGCRGLLPQDVAVDDCFGVVGSVGAPRNGVQKVVQFAQHHGAAGMGALVSEAEAGGGEGFCGLEGVLVVHGGRLAD